MGSDSDRLRTLVEYLDLAGDAGARPVRPGSLGMLNHEFLRQWPEALSMARVVYRRRPGKVGRRVGGVRGTATFRREILVCYVRCP